MDNNDFQTRADIENRRVQAEKVSLILELVKEIKADILDTRKEVRLIREELRNLDKLRPLRSTAKDLEN